MNNTTTQQSIELLSPKASQRKREERHASKTVTIQHAERGAAKNRKPIPHPT